MLYIIKGPSAVGTEFLLRGTRTAPATRGMFPFERRFKVIEALCLEEALRLSGANHFALVRHTARFDERHGPVSPFIIVTDTSPGAAHAILRHIDPNGVDPDGF